MSKKALIVSGGWEGHKPAEVAEVFGARLEAEEFSVTKADSLAVYEEEDLGSYDLIVPNWTMDRLNGEATKNLSRVVTEGTGLAGAHGGMCDSFRGNLDYMWMTGGQFLGHPHVAPFTVTKTAVSHPVTAGIPKAFSYDSEQYYMMVDPAVTVLLDTVYESGAPECRMPMAWVREWGRGRVFFSALGHQPDEYTKYPHVLDMVIRGMLWAAR